MMADKSPNVVSHTPSLVFVLNNKHYRLPCVIKIINGWWVYVSIPSESVAQYDSFQPAIACQLGSASSRYNLYDVNLNRDSNCRLYHTES